MTNFIEELKNYQNTVNTAKAFVKRNMRNNSLTVRSKRTGQEYIIAQQYNAYDGWFVYEGCDLIIGDVTFDMAVRVLVRETM